MSASAVSTRQLDWMQRGPNQCAGGHQSCRQSTGFTLVELLVVISIITLLASIVLAALAGVQETARADRTRAQIARIDTLIMEKWESYRTRRLPVDLNRLRANEPNAMASLTANQLNHNLQLKFEKQRVDAVRELMRMELPERITDLFDDVDASFSTTRQAPALWHAYRRKVAMLLAKKDPVNNAIPNNLFTQPGAFENWVTSDLPNGQDRWSNTNEHAECLYLILSQTVDQEVAALEFFRENEIADQDGDGMPEILDGWGSPIRFLRWAPGVTVPVPPTRPDGQVITMSVIPGGRQDNAQRRDPFDMGQIYIRWQALRTQVPTVPSFALYPLIYSAGPDKSPGLVTGSGGSVRYGDQSLLSKNNPFLLSNSPMVGAPNDIVGSSGNIVNDHVDNITNHNLAGT